MNNKKLIDELQLCAGQCTHCYNACLIEKDKNKLERCMVFDQDCADICRLTAALLERNSENTDIFLELCSQMCERCATECEKHSHMEHCKKCAEVCRECAEMCMEHSHQLAE